MKVRVNGSYELLGTDIKLEEGKVYAATPATNQPDFAKQGLVFVSGVLLKRDEYEFEGVTNE